MKKEKAFSIIVIIFSIFLALYSTTGIKSQFIRLLDIFIYGPFLIWLSFKNKDNIFIHTMLLIMGVTTIVYNGKNYIKQL